jgi:hypothetical protein
MKRIELPIGTTYRQAKVNAGALIAHDNTVNSVRVIVEKDTHKMWIEYTEFPQKTVDKLINM